MLELFKDIKWISSIVDTVPAMRGMIEEVLGQLWLDETALLPEYLSIHDLQNLGIGGGCFVSCNDQSAVVLFRLTGSIFKVECPICSCKTHAQANLMFIQNRTI